MLGVGALVLARLNFSVWLLYVLNSISFHCVITAKCYVAALQSQRDWILKTGQDKETPGTVSKTSPGQIVATISHGRGCRSSQRVYQYKGCILFDPFIEMPSGT